MRTLIRGGTVITMDLQGDLSQGDVLVSDDRIAEIAPRIPADDARVVDATGCIVIPGLVNAHMHTWQTALRGLAANWTLLEYFRKMHAGLATVFEVWFSGYQDNRDDDHRRAALFRLLFCHVVCAVIRPL